MADSLEQLKSRLAEYYGLESLTSLLVWDQRTMMPPAGGHHRGDHLALLEGLAHGKLTDPEVGRLLDELAPLESSLDPDSWDAATIRVARRDFEKAVQVPSDLRAEMARSGAAAMPVWLEAKSTSNFDIFLPELERNVELRRRYVDCFGPQSVPYDVLLDDFEPEMKTAEVTAIFDEIKAVLVPLIAELREREVDDSFLVGDFPIETQAALDYEVVDLFGHRPNSWRIDPTEHPFAAGPGIDDVRITTHYYREELKSLFSTMHEYGTGSTCTSSHARWRTCPSGRTRHSVSTSRRAACGRTSSDVAFRSGASSIRGCRRSSRSRSRASRSIGSTPRSTRLSRRSIRINADEVTYGMHVILRFELEQDIINGRVELGDLPDRWAQKMHGISGSRCPTMRTASCRTCTGQPG
jgi:carboxypeptidase Taq